MSQATQDLGTKKHMGSLAMAAVIAISSLFLQSCTEEQIDTALAVIAIGVIISVDDEPTPHRPPRYHECYDRHSRQYCDRNLRPDQRRHFSLVSNSNLQVAGLSAPTFVMQKPLATAVTELTNEQKIQVMAQKYNLSLSASEKLQNAINKAANNDFSGVDEIGLARTDIKALYENQKLTRYSIVNLSASLGLQFEQTKVFIGHLQSDIQKAKAQLATQQL